MKVRFSILPLVYAHCNGEWGWQKIEQSHAPADGQPNRHDTSIIKE
jgi:hypothetical protein